MDKVSNLVTAKAWPGDKISIRTNNNEAYILEVAISSMGPMYIASFFSEDLEEVAMKLYDWQFDVLERKE